MENFESRIEAMGKDIAPYAKAKAERTYIEQFRKSKKAMLMQESNGKTIADREAYAYSHPEYLALLEGLKSAVHEEERTKFALEKFKIEFSHWQTCCANDRWAKDRV
jgi:hypothetical protein